MHIPFAGGAFGRHLFGESAIEAAQISQALGMPIRLLWTRNDDMRHGRFRPMTHHALRATWTAGVMLSWDHRIGAAEMDLRHGYGAALALPGRLAPGGRAGGVQRDGVGAVRVRRHAAA